MFYSPWESSPPLSLARLLIDCTVACGPMLPRNSNRLINSCFESSKWIHTLGIFRRSQKDTINRLACIAPAFFLLFRPLSLPSEVVMLYHPSARALEC